MAMRTLIVDDERMARKRIRTLLVPDADVEIVGEATNGRDAVSAIRDRQPDLVFLDVQMPELDGFAVVHAVGVAAMPVTVFVTAFDQYALKAFEANALDYLTKPFDRERFQTSLDRAKMQVRLRDTAKAGDGTSAPTDRPSEVSDVGERLLALLAGLERRQQYAERLIVKSGGRAVFLSVADDAPRSVALRPCPSVHGDAVAILRDGTRIQVSRTYRDALGGDT